MQLHWNFWQLSLSVSERLQMWFMDVVTAYLYGSLDIDIYVKSSRWTKTTIEIHIQRNALDKIKKITYFMGSSNLEERGII